MRFNAAYSFGLTTTLAGAGTIDFVTGVQTISGPYNVTGTTSVSGATVTFANSVTIPTLSFTGGTINIASGQTFDLTSLFNWTIGTLGGGGTFNPEAGLSLNGTGAITLNGATLNNPLGQTARPGGGVHTFVLANSAVLNSAGALSRPQNNNGLLFGGGTGTTSFNNDGTFTATPALVLPYTFGSGIAFNNSGTVNASSGTSPSTAATQTVGTAPAGWWDRFINHGAKFAKADSLPVSATSRRHYPAALSIQPGLGVGGLDA
jgi:hypothetical protein